MCGSKDNIPYGRAVAHASPDYPFIVCAMKVEQGRRLKTELTRNRQCREAEPAI